jgi:hypothetical protein
LRSKTPTGRTALSISLKERKKEKKEEEKEKNMLLKHRMS